jgi:hypothetical protein
MGHKVLKGMSFVGVFGGDGPGGQAKTALRPARWSEAVGFETWGGCGPSMLTSS